MTPTYITIPEEMFKRKLFYLRRAMNSFLCASVLFLLVILLFMLSLVSRANKRVISSMTEYRADFPTFDLIAEDAKDSSVSYGEDSHDTDTPNDGNDIALMSRNLTSKFKFMNATSAKYTRFRILRDQSPDQCNQLKIVIQSRNHFNDIKHHGGDYFWVWIRNLELNASAAADQIIDHGNGTYTALVTLFWVGDVEVNVTLIHSSEAIEILRRIRDTSQVPRNAYQGTFITENKRVTKPCHISTNMFIYPYSKSGETLTSPEEFCNFTDPKTGAPWFCVKPRDLSCDTYREHAKQDDGYKKARATFRSLISEEEHRIVMDSLVRINIAADSTNNIQVKESFKRTLGIKDNQHYEQRCLKSPAKTCVPGLPSKPRDQVTGYYYKDAWFSNICRKVDFTSASSIRTCLQHKDIYFYGDSTGRQWFEYLIKNLMETGSVQMNVTHSRNGPIKAFDTTSNISLGFYFHGFPFTAKDVKVFTIDYIANRIDNLNTGPEPIIVISIWAHFWVSDLAFYRQRLRTVKHAIERLKRRTPGAKIFFKTPNTVAGSSRETGYHFWYVVELHRVLREEFEDFLDVTVLDVWDMTIGHRTGLNIHPKEVVVAQEVSMLLSFLCTEESV